MLPKSPQVDLSGPTGETLRADLTHPWWCSPTACSAADEPDLTSLVAALASGHHRGQAHGIAPEAPGDLAIGVQAASWAPEPIDSTPPVAEITISRGDCHSVEGYALDGRQVRQLVTLLAGMLPAFAEGPVRRREDLPAGCPAWCAGHEPGEPHARLTGAVAVSTLEFEVLVLQYPDTDRPVVQLAEHAGTDTAVTDFLPATARTLGLALLAAAALAEGGAL